MELFYKNGHISEEGFQLLIEQKANEFQRLELSEHLSFCEACMARYLEYLDNMEELEVEIPSVHAMVYKAVQRKAGPKWKDCMTTVAAACIALFLWSSGVFHWETNLQYQHSAEAISNHMLLITQRADDFSWKLYQGYLGMMDKIDWRGDYRENK